MTEHRHHIIGDGDAHERVSLIVVLLIGVILLRSLVKSGPLASTKRNDLSKLIEYVMRAAASRGMCASV